VSTHENFCSTDGAASALRAVKYVAALRPKVSVTLMVAQRVLALTKLPLTFIK
jgi:hypothetical protein